MIGRFVLFSFALCAAALSTGCSPYVDGYFYLPHPATAEIHAESTSATQPAVPSTSPLSAYATIVGVRRTDDDAHLPLSIEVRLRLDSHSPQNITFDPHTLDLTNGDLVRFPPPLVVQQTLTLQPGQPMMVQANFPFPPGLSYDNMNLQTLQLRWAVQIDGHPVNQVADFHRYMRYYYDPYWEGGYGYPYPDYGYPYWGVRGRVIIR